MQLEVNMIKLNEMHKEVNICMLICKILASCNEYYSWKVNVCDLKWLHRTGLK